MGSKTAKKPVDPAVRARRQRIRRKRARQSVVFGVLIAFMALAGLVSVAVYNQAISLPFARAFSADVLPSDPPSVPACLVEGKEKPVGYRKIRVRVFNASERRGLAATTAKILEERGFQVIATGNVTKDEVWGVRIAYGRKGVARAYTLAAHIPGATLVYDDRTNARIDLTIGAGFSEVLPEEEVRLESGQPMSNLPGCQPLESLTPVPALHMEDTDD